MIHKNRQDIKSTEEGAVAFGSIGRFPSGKEIKPGYYVINELPIRIYSTTDQPKQETEKT